MSGPLFSFGIVVVMSVVLLGFVGLGAIWLVPIIIVALLPLLARPLLGAFAKTGAGGPEPGGVPSTQQASYDPQVKP